MKTFICLFVCFGDAAFPVDKLKLIYPFNIRKLRQNDSSAP